MTTAHKEEKYAVQRKINKSRRIKRNKEIEEEKREFTMLRSNIITQIPYVDMDKKIFLEEFLKLLGYADMYYK